MPIFEIWLDVKIHVTSFSQSESTISLLSSYVIFMTSVLDQKLVQCSRYHFINEKNKQK